jgi:hypothetical protein
VVPHVINKMRHCEAIKKSGFRCAHAAQKGLAVCGKHEGVKQDRCIGMNTNGRRCAQMPSKGNFCKKHHEVHLLRRMREYSETLWNQLWGDWFHYRLTADQVQDRITRDYNAGLLNLEWMRELSYRRYDLTMEELHEPQWLDDREEPAAFHEDPQNVHRAVTSEQTNKGLAIYLEEHKKVHVHVAGNTLVELMTVWDLHDSPLFKDMVHWFWMRTCRAEYDDLYHNALAGLWQMIKKHEHKDELQKRLREEATESIGMCCEGHLSRLVNVMVGFDPRFDPPVSKKELLQQKMAEIAAREISTEDKQKEATQWMDEHGIVLEERAAWLEAF